MWKKSIQKSFSTSCSKHQIKPPVHFSQPSIPQSSTNSFHGSYQSQNDNSRSFRDVSLLLSMITLSFLAIDNYVNRVKLEKVVNETVLLNLKTLKNQQIQFDNATKRKNLLVINERRENNKKITKMALHIALLRQQLKENGHDPISIEEALKKYDLLVRSNTSINNVTDQILYLNDETDLKTYLPTTYDYDRSSPKD